MNHPSDDPWQDISGSKSLTPSLPPPPPPPQSQTPPLPNKRTASPSLPSKKRQNRSIDLPALPEGRLFEPQLEEKEEAEEEEVGEAAAVNTNTNWQFSKSSQAPGKELEPPPEVLIATRSTSEAERKPGCCARCCKCPRPPPLPRWLRRGANRFYRQVGGLATYVVFFLLLYLLLWIFTANEALPPMCYLHHRGPDNVSTDKPAVVCLGGQTLTIIIFYAFAFASGQLVELFRLPGLLGMLLSGLSLRCISVFISPYEIFMGGPPAFNASTSITLKDPSQVGIHEPIIRLDTFADDINTTSAVADPLVILAATLRVNKALSSALRQVALATILTRAGLGLEPATLKRIWKSIIRLTMMPCLGEAAACILVSKFLMSWPWAWAGMMGFVLAAVSPAVVVPNMLRLEVAGWGVAQGIPTLIMAASSMDDVLAITGFGVMQAIAFAKGAIGHVLVMGVLEVAAGAILGVLLAMVLWLLPPAGMEHNNSIRGIFLYAISIAAVTGTIKLGLPGAGALCCLICSLTCSFGWQHGMPWLFKRSNHVTLGNRNANAKPESSHTGIDLDMDMEAWNNNEDDAAGGGGLDQQLWEGGPTEHHEYYKQHLRSLRRLINKSGGTFGGRSALATVSKSSRRFSLPEPKPVYEEEEYDEEMMDFRKRQAHMKRSYSVSRPDTAAARSERANSENLRVLARESTNDDTGLTVLEANTSAVLPTSASKLQGQGLLQPSRGGFSRLDDVHDDEEEEESEATKAALLELDKKKGTECLKVMRGFMATCWWFVQPLLFCLIGADIPVEKLRPDTIGLGIASILLSLMSRIFWTIMAVACSPFTWKERFFVAIAWIPKATVQAAIGPIALDSARLSGDSSQIDWGEQIITLAALSILVTAPLAALLIPLVAPYLLRQDLIRIQIEDQSNDNQALTIVNVNNCRVEDQNADIRPQHLSKSDRTTFKRRYTQPIRKDEADVRLITPPHPSIPSQTQETSL